MISPQGIAQRRPYCSAGQATAVHPEWEASQAPGRLFSTLGRIWPPPLSAALTYRETGGRAQHSFLPFSCYNSERHGHCLPGCSYGLKMLRANSEPFPCLHWAGNSLLCFPHSGTNHDPLWNTHLETTRP